MQPFANPQVFKRLGYCPEIENSYDDMTGREFVALMGALSGIPSSRLSARVSEVIEEVGMSDRCDRKIGGYSKGMRQRIKIAQGIVHDPDVLILDEPLNGLDPMGRREVTGILQDLALQGKCVVVSSHILYEVEQMTRNILIMSKGRLVAQGDIYEIRALIDSHPHRIAISVDPARSRGRDLAKRLLDMEYVLSLKFTDATGANLEIETRNPELFYSQFPDLVLENGFVVTQFDSPDNNLEAVFRYLVEGPHQGVGLSPSLPPPPARVMVSAK
jgi:ABC-2 type transport system ATP-binding protein